MGFAKLHGSIIHSSIWMEDSDTKVVWITMLAMADGTGTVYASVGGLARAAGVSREACADALTKFLGPDPDSRDGTTGERIRKVEGGWFVINHANYRDRQTRAQELAAERVRRHRKRKGVTSNDGTVAPRCSALPHSGLVEPSASGTLHSDSGTLPSGEADQAVPVTPKRPRSNYPPSFEAFWTAYGKPKGKKAAFAAWKRIAPDDELAAEIAAAARRQAEAVEVQFRKDPERWLRGEHWTDSEARSRPPSSGWAGHKIMEPSPIPGLQNENPEDWSWIDKP